MLEFSRIVARDLAAARRFYAATAKPLGLRLVEAGDGFEVGEGDRPVLRVEGADAMTRVVDEEPETQPTHVALEARDGFSVRSFFRAALEAGGRQIGYPSPQPTGGQGSYYAARVMDPDGNLIECGWRH